MEKLLIYDVRFVEGLYTLLCEKISWDVCGGKAQVYP
jgi:hypothetical protein